MEERPRIPTFCYLRVKNFSFYQQKFGIQLEWRLLVWIEGSEWDTRTTLGQSTKWTTTTLVQDGRGRKKWSDYRDFAGTGRRVRRIRDWWEVSFGRPYFSKCCCGSGLIKRDRIDYCTQYPIKRLCLSVLTFLFGHGHSLKSLNWGRPLLNKSDLWSRTSVTYFLPCVPRVSRKAKVSWIKRKRKVSQWRWSQGVNEITGDRGGERT